MEPTALSSLIEQALTGPHFKPLADVLAAHFGPDASQELEASVRQRLAQLLAEHENDEAALREESFFYILPSIAVYETLRRHTDEASALALFRSLYYQAAYGGAQRLQKQALDREFREAFPHRMAGDKEGEGGGFCFRLVQDDRNGAEFHVLRCPYVDFCGQYGCPELVPVFCGCDDIVYGNIHPLLRWERSRTLGRGDALCDFRFAILKESPG